MVRHQVEEGGVCWQNNPLACGARDFSDALPSSNQWFVQGP